MLYTETPQETLRIQFVVALGNLRAATAVLAAESDPAERRRWQGIVDALAERCVTLADRADGDGPRLRD